MAKKKSFVLKAKHKSKKGGLTEAGRTAYNRATGSNLKRPQPEGGSRKKSYCARSKGQMKDHNIDCSKTPDKRICLARRRWKCNKSLQKSDMQPKAKLAAFLRDHIDNKLALKAAEPTITKSDEKTSMSALMKALKECACKKSIENLTKAPVSFEGTEDAPYTMVWRMQNEKGEGPYRAKKRWQYGKPHSDKTGRPGPTRDIGFTPQDLEEGQFGHQFGKYGQYPFGFESLEQLNAWFSPNEQKRLADMGYRPTQVKAQKVWASGKQAFYKPFNKSFKKSDKLPGGKGDTKDISDFDAKEVEMGLKVEMEHTKDREVAQEIVTDHLTEDPSYYSKLKGSGLADELEKAGRCWEGYEPTPGKKPYSKGSCRKIKKLQKNDNEEYDFNTLEELQNHLNENHPLKIDEELASNYAAQSNNHYFDPYSDDVVKYRDYYTAHPSIDNDKFEETYLNHFDTLDQMHRRAGEKLKEDWENQKHKEWNEYKDKYENWANNILKTIHNHCGKDNYSVDEAKTTNSKYIWGTKGEDGPEFLIRLGDHPPKDEFDNEFNDKSKKTLSLLFPENTFMRSKNHQEWNKDFNRAQQKRLSFSSKHKIGDHTDVHDFLSNLDKSMQKSIKQKLIKALCVQKLQKSISAEAIEAGQYQGEKLDSHHHNRLGNEYKGMAQKAHKMGDRKKAREFHDKALHHFKMADKMGFQEEEPLEKKISGKVAAGLTALSGMVSSPTATTAAKPPKIEAPKPVPQEKYFDLKNELSTQTIQNMFLHNIAQLESSGGKNKDHPVIKDPESIHYGMKAVGNFAMMPLTIQTLANRHARDGGKDPKILKIQKMNPHTGEINKYVEANPDLEMVLARNLATSVLKTHGYTPEAAYSWKYGHNLSPQQIKEPDRQEKMKSDTYVQEFKQLQQGGSPKGLVPAINRNIN